MDVPETNPGEESAPGNGAARASFDPAAQPRRAE